MLEIDYWIILLKYWGSTSNKFWLYFLLFFTYPCDHNILYFKFWSWTMTLPPILANDHKYPVYFLWKYPTLVQSKVASFWNVSRGLRVPSWPRPLGEPLPMFSQITEVGFFEKNYFFHFFEPKNTFFGGFEDPKYFWGLTYLFWPLN